MFVNLSLENYQYVIDAPFLNFLSSHSITKLHFSKNQFEQNTFTDDIQGFQHLESLSFNLCNITSLPESLGKLPNLKVLDLAGSSIETLPGHMAQMQRLTSLNLSHTKLTNIPSFIFSLPFLKVLDLSELNEAQLSTDDLFSTAPRLELLCFSNHKNKAKELQSLLTLKQLAQRAEPTLNQTDTLSNQCIRMPHTQDRLLNNSPLCKQLKELESEISSIAQYIREIFPAPHAIKTVAELNHLLHHIHFNSNDSERLIHQLEFGLRNLGLLNSQLSEIIRTTHPYPILAQFHSELTVPQNTQSIFRLAVLPPDNSDRRLQLLNEILEQTQLNQSQKSIIAMKISQLASLLHLNAINIHRDITIVRNAIVESIFRLFNEITPCSYHHANRIWQTWLNMFLIKCVKHNNLGLTQRFLQHGAQINIQTNDGETPLYLATAKALQEPTPENIQMVEFLIGHGANPHIQDNKGNSAYDLASAADDDELSTLLFLQPRKHQTPTPMEEDTQIGLSDWFG